MDHSNEGHYRINCSFHNWKRNANYEV